MKTIEVKWTGLRPLVMHNGRLADPTDEHVRRIKAITAKGSKKLTDSDYEERDRLEWEGGAYWSEEMGFYLPSDNIERCILDGARKSRLGKDCAAAVFVREEEVEIEHELDRLSLAEIYADARYTLRKGVRVTQSRIIRVRPKIPAWAMKFTVEYDEKILNARQIATAMEDAGALVGVGDWRPKYGRFTVEVLS